MLKVTKKRKKKHNKIIALAKNKLNKIDTLLSSALNDSKITHEDCTNIITEKNIYENIKENIENMIELIIVYYVRVADTSASHVKKIQKNIDSKVIKTKNNRKMMLSRCSICNNKKSTFLSEGSGIFDSLIYNTNRDRRLC